jgi:hypothetical protein
VLRLLAGVTMGKVQFACRPAKEVLVQRRLKE